MLVKKLINEKIHKYMEENFTEVLHTTLDPNKPGVVRIHLVPPKAEGEETGSSIVILNGQDIIPVNTSWTILLIEFIKEVNKYSGKSVSEADSQVIMDNTVKAVRKVFPLLSKKLIKNDIYTIMKTFTQVALGEEPDEDVDYISIGEYAPYMRAPHRMDLLVSSMVKEGKWHCNQNCIHCYAAGQELVSEEELSTQEWKSIIDKCRESLIPQITFTGGEPTMREDLFDLIEYASWFVTRLNTNGIKLTKEYCEKLVNVSLDSCQITFYSCDKEIHNKLVGMPQYDNTLAGIENAVEAGLSVSINTPLCSLNREYVKTLEFLNKKGVRYVTCSGLITTGNALKEQSEELQLSTEELKEILEEAAKYCAENDMEISFTSPGWIEEDFFEKIHITKPTCGACLSNMAITPAGNVVPCQSYLSGKPLGNMLNDAWEDIWGSDECRKHRDFSVKMTGECPLRKNKSKKEEC
ncbi:MAG: radical SAM protein [Lachnospiraceae bacterium]|nr:radical SAM protein [Lachnospiraceae bacterium]